MDKIKSAIAFVRAAYNSLPVWAKSLLVAIEGGVLGYLGQWAATPGPMSFRQLLGGIGGAIVASFRMWIRNSPVTKGK